jgi:hypothetical protein
MFLEPRAAPQVTRRQLPARPAPSFPAFDGTSTVLYDLTAMRETNLGPGRAGSFSPDGARMAWVSMEGAAEVAKVLTLASPVNATSARSLGPARTAEWFDNRRLIAFLPGSNNRELINADTGAHEPVPSVGSPDAFARTLPDGRRLTSRLIDQVVLEGLPAGRPNTAQVVAFTLTEPDGRVLLAFEGFHAGPAAPDELVVAARPLPAGTINIFMVRISTGAAQFVTTARFSAPNWPVGANADYVVWTEAYCGPDRGMTRFLDRRTGAVTELDQSLWVTMTPGGLIGAGEFGPSDLIDPRTLQYVAVLPPRAGQTGAAIDVSWSPDYKWASRGQAFGHGGLCG